MIYDATILASGNASRSKLNYNKVLYKINDKPMVYLASYPFLIDDRCQSIIITSNEKDIETIKELFKAYKKVKVILGGKTRKESSYEALKLVTSPYVLIHDGARPNVTKDLIDRIIDGLELSNAIIPVIDVIDTIKIVENNKVESTLNRNTLKAVQTPQGFNSKMILEAYEHLDENYSDDSSLFEKYYDEKVVCVDGDVNNIKYTTKKDFI